MFSGWLAGLIGLTGTHDLFMHVMPEKQLTRLRCALLHLTNADLLFFATEFTTDSDKDLENFGRKCA